MGKPVPESTVRFYLKGGAILAVDYTTDEKAREVAGLWQQWLGKGYTRTTTATIGDEGGNYRVLLEEVAAVCVVPVTKG